MTLYRNLTFMRAPCRLPEQFPPLIYDLCWKLQLRRRVDQIQRCLSLRQFLSRPLVIGSDRIDIIIGVVVIYNLNAPTVTSLLSLLGQALLHPVKLSLTAT